MEYLKPLKSKIIGCLHCGLTIDKLSMREKIIAGFGSAFILQDKKIVYSKEPNIEWEDAPTLMKFELLARKNPKSDWRYELDLPLRNAEYQRQGKNNWVLIKTGQGFA